MNKHLSAPLFSKLLSLKLPNDDYAVIGVTCMLIRDIVPEVKDIDIIARKSAWEKAISLGKPLVPASKVGLVVDLFDNKIEVFNAWAPGEWDIDELIDTADVIDGIRFVTLENVRKWKQIFGRDKDLVHIKLIDKFLNKNHDIKK